MGDLVFNGGTGISKFLNLLSSFLLCMRFLKESLVFGVEINSKSDAE